MAGEKILFADDEVLIRKLVTTYFARRGYVVTTASDGQEALRLIAADPPDLLITDVRMPHMNGLELTDRLRASRTTAHLPIIMLSAYNEIHDALAGFGRGADEYIPKPVELAVLGARVEVLLRRVSVTHTSSTTPTAWPTPGAPTVLVVEDDPTVRLLECSLLRHAGYAVVEASTGHQALAFASTSRTDLVVLDVSLPSISGLQVLETLAADARTQGIPVLVVSSYAALIGEADRARMAGVMSKPLDPSQFLSVVRTLVGPESASREYVPAAAASVRHQTADSLDQDAHV